MKGIVRAAQVAFALAGMAFLAQGASAEVVKYKAALKGASEVPANTTAGTAPSRPRTTPRPRS